MSTPPSGPQTRYRVLVVEADPSSRASLQALLATDFDVESDSSPERALERLRNESFDLLCTNHQMPGMSGPELYEATRQMPRRVGCLLITTMPALLTARFGETPDLLAMIEKPFEPARLVNLLQQLGRLTAIRRGLARAPTTSSATARPRTLDPLRPPSIAAPAVAPQTAQPSAPKPGENARPTSGGGPTQPPRR